MSAQTMIDELAAKQGIPNSVDPVFESEVTQAVYDELRNSFAVVRLIGTPITISTDKDNASIIDNLTFLSPSTGFELDAPNNAVKNVTGETLLRTDGDFDLQLDRAGGGGGTSLVSIYSETFDGTSWSINDGSLRTEEINNATEGIVSFPSFTGAWPNGHSVRFRIYKTGGGTIRIIAPTDVINTEAVNGLGVYWSLHRQS